MLLLQACKNGKLFLVDLAGSEMVRRLVLAFVLHCIVVG